jgi:hypothetical protein
MLIESPPMRRRALAFAAALDGLLTPTNLRLAAGAALLASIFATGAAVALGSPPLDARGHPIAADLLARLAGGRIVLDGAGARLYDVAYQREVSRALLGGAEPRALTLYTAPPFLALVYGPLAQAPYLWAATIWTALSVGLVGLSVALLWRLTPSLGRWGLGTALLLALGFYPTIELLGNGQDAALSLALLAGGLRLLVAGRDGMAGGLLGLGVFKPQLFLLVPIYLALRGRWRALGAWVAVAALLVVLSAALVGIEGLERYLQLLGSPVYNESERSLAWKTLSLTGPVRQLLPASAVLPLSLGMSAVGAAALWLGLRRIEDEPVAFAYLVLVVALFSPKAMIYDYVIVLLPAMVLAEVAPRRQTRWALVALAVLAFSAAGRQAAFGGAAWPISALAAQWTLVPVGVLAWTAATYLVARRPTNQPNASGRVAASQRGRRWVS